MVQTGSLRRADAAERLRTVQEGRGCEKHARAFLGARVRHRRDSGTLSRDWTLGVDSGSLLFAVREGWVRQVFRYVRHRLGGRFHDRSDHRECTRGCSDVYFQRLSHVVRQRGGGEKRRDPSERASSNHHRAE